MKFSFIEKTIIAECILAFVVVMVFCGEGSYDPPPVPVVKVVVL